MQLSPPLRSSPSFFAQKPHQDQPQLLKKTSFPKKVIIVNLSNVSLGFVLMKYLLVLKMHLLFMVISLDTQLYI